MKTNVSDEAVYLNGELSKEKLTTLADAFHELASTFSHMPKRRDKLSETELDHIFESLGEKFCKECPGREECWEKNYYETYQTAFEILDRIDSEQMEGYQSLQARFASRCIAADEFLEESVSLLNKERNNLKWNNRVIAAREAVSEQLKGMSQIITQMKEDVCLVGSLDAAMERNIRFVLRSSRISVRSLFMINRSDKRREFRMTLRTKNGRCVSTREIAGLISSTCGIRLAAGKNSKTIINGDWYPLTLVEDVNFKMLYGVARRIKDQERVSGDNFTCIENQDRKNLICLSDGMGAGIHASRESENVIELIEQLIEAGFEKQVALRLINSLLVVKTDEPLFTTVDLCEIDLYNGCCEFVKIGAAISFIIRKNWVEPIETASLPAGLMYDMEIETLSRKLYDGDMIVMMTDGAMDVFSPEEGAEAMTALLKEIKTNNPKEFAQQLLDKVLAYSGQAAGDDMTILVAGIWGK